MDDVAPLGPAETAARLPFAPRVAALREAVRGGRPGGPLLLKTVGCAAWDLAAARVALSA